MSLGECIGLCSKQSSVNNLTFDATVWEVVYVAKEKHGTLNSTMRFSRVNGVWFRGISFNNDLLFPVHSERLNLLV